MTNIDRSTEIIEGFMPRLPGRLATVLAKDIARTLAKEGLLMPDGMNTQTETVGPYFPEDEEMPDLPEGTAVTRIVGPWEEA